VNADHRPFCGARLPATELETPLARLVDRLALFTAPVASQARAATSPTGSGPHQASGVSELPDPVGPLFASSPGLAAIAWRRAEHFAKGYDAAHDDAQGHDKRRFSLFNLTRQRLTDAADFIADGELSADHADAYRIHLAYAGALIAAELDRHDREMARAADTGQP
jgi:hypothetical protein|tara:strand:+ start:37923 stop:38420 length:498 start_codon:yes stop_codon:yes gene_type:complete